MQQPSFSNPLSLALSVLVGTAIGAAAMNSSQATAETPSRLTAESHKGRPAETVYLPALYTDAQRAAVEQPLPAQF